eukprot:Gb_28151 [translate_table: standard]
MEPGQVPLKLEELNLQRCYKLKRVPDSIDRLRGLQKLDFSECLLLKTLSEEFCYLESLEVLNLNFCLNLEYLPSGFGGMRRLRDVSLRECEKLKALPESFGLLPQIEYLDMYNCKNVKIEEGSFGSISTLKQVNLLNCRKLETFPTQLTRQRSLKKLGVATVDEYSGGIADFGHNEIFIDIPENFGELSKLTEVELGNLTRIPQSIGKLSQLNLISPSSQFTFTASAIPYPTAWLDSYHFQMMSKRNTMPFVSGSSGLKCSIPAATTKKCAAIIICFVSVLQLIDELHDKQLAAPPLTQLCFELEDTVGISILHKEQDFSHSKLGDSIHLKLFAVDKYHLKKKISINVLVDKLTLSVKCYFKCGWIKIIEEGEEKLIQQICSDFFRELRRQRPLAVARASAPSLLDLRNVHALDIANCTIRRTLYLYKTPIQEENMELVLRKKPLFWRDDKELEHLDLSIMNTTSIPLFLTLKSMVNLYNMEVIISASSVEEAYKDELQEYQDNSIGHPSETLALFNRMQWVEVTPNSITIVSALQACAHLGALQQLITLLDMCAKCGIVELAHQLFDKMPTKNVVPWSAMITRRGIHGHVGLVNEGGQYLEFMIQNYCITQRMEHYACMLDLLGYVGHLDEVRDLIENMPLDLGVSVWGRLLGTCKIHCNVDLGELVE